MRARRPACSDALDPRTPGPRRRAARRRLDPHRVRSRPPPRWRDSTGAARDRALERARSRDRRVPREPGVQRRASGVAPEPGQSRPPRGRASPRPRPTTAARSRSIRASCRRGVNLSAGDAGARAATRQCEASRGAASRTRAAGTADVHRALATGAGAAASHARSTRGASAARPRARLNARYAFVYGRRLLHDAGRSAEARGVLARAGAGRGTGTDRDDPRGARRLQRRLMGTRRRRGAGRRQRMRAAAGVGARAAAATVRLRPACSPKRNPHRLVPAVEPHQRSRQEVPASVFLLNFEANADAPACVELEPFNASAVGLARCRLTLTERDAPHRSSRVKRGACGS